MEKERNQRINTIDKSTDTVRSSVDHLATALVLYLTLWFSQRLILGSGGAIDDSTENYNAINQLEVAKAGFFSESIVPFLATIGLIFFKITEQNKKYFKAVEKISVPPNETNETATDVTDCLTGIEDEVRAAYGFNVDDNNVTIEPNGWLANIGDLKSVYDGVRNSAMKAVSTKMPLTDFLKILKKEIIGDQQVPGLVQSHFKTIVWDVFAEFDRTVGYKSATCLGYRAAIYEGGLIDHSRAFCIERNGNVYTFDEIKKFGTPEDRYDSYTDKATGDFAGKPRFDYDPFLDQGGYNCRHSYSYIPDRLAIRLRPELEEVFESKDK